MEVSQSGCLPSVDVVRFRDCVCLDVVPRAIGVEAANMIEIASSLRRIIVRGQLFGSGSE